MPKPRLNKTKSTFSKDPKINRATQIRRDEDKVRTPKVTLYDIDYAIKWFITNTIKPTVLDNQETIPVPVMYASPEKWKSIEAQGFLRDNKGKILAPIIAYRRSGFEQRPELKKNKVLEDKSNQIVLKTKFTQKNRYDKFSILTNQKPVEEFYYINIPEYITVTYDVIVWCDYTQQVNEIAEAFKYWEGKAWGDTYKFITTTDSFTFENTNSTGDDKVTKATFTLKTQAHLVPKDTGKDINLQKSFSVGKIVFQEKVVDDINNIPDNDFSGSLNE